MTILSSRDVTSQIYQDALTIRKEVFVEQQGVPLSLEVDKNEANCLHLVYYKEQEALATCRLLPVTKEDYLLQRMAVRTDYQQQGIGQILLKEALRLAEEEGANEVNLHSQKHAETFYAKLGFEAYGKPFEEAGIEHINMLKRF